MNQEALMQDAIPPGKSGAGHAREATRFRQGTGTAVVDGEVGGVTQQGYAARKGQTALRPCGEQVNSEKGPKTRYGPLSSSSKEGRQRPFKGPEMSNIKYWTVHVGEINPAQCRGRILFERGKKKRNQNMNPITCSNFPQKGSANVEVRNSGLLKKRGTSNTTPPRKQSVLSEIREGGLGENIKVETGGLSEERKKEGKRNKIYLKTSEKKKKDRRKMKF